MKPADDRTLNPTHGEAVLGWKLNLDDRRHRETLTEVRALICRFAERNTPFVIVDQSDYCKRIVRVAELRVACC